MINCVFKNDDFNTNGKDPDAGAYSKAKFE